MLSVLLMNKDVYFCPELVKFWCILVSASYGIVVITAWRKISIRMKWMNVTSQSAPAYTRVIYHQMWKRQSETATGLTAFCTTRSAARRGFSSTMAKGYNLYTLTDLASVVDSAHLLLVYLERRGMEERDGSGVGDGIWPGPLINEILGTLLALIMSCLQLLCGKKEWIRRKNEKKGKEEEEREGTDGKGGIESYPTDDFLIGHCHFLQQRLREISYIV